MQRRNWFLAAAALVLGVCTLILGLHGFASSPILVGEPAQATACGEALMKAVSQSDFETVGSLLFGNPRLTADHETEAAQVIWDAYVQSIAYQVDGPCRTVDTGLALDVQVSCLDIAASTQDLEQYTKSRSGAEAESAALTAAVQQCLKAHAVTMQRTLTLKLVPENGQWKVLPEAELLDFLSGSLSGK